MNQENTFVDLIRRVREGDETAATELVKQYEPEIRRAVRVRLHNPKMQQVLDSMDICQSVLGNFFARAASGQFELNRPEQLLKLLVTMARNKLKDHARKHQAARRDLRKIVGGGMAALEMVAGKSPSPSQIVMGREMVQEIQNHLTAEERYLAEQRALGREWADLGAELGSTPEALRKRYSRSVEQAAKALGLDEVEHE